MMISQNLFGETCFFATQRSVWKVICGLKVLEQDISPQDNPLQWGRFEKVYVWEYNGFAIKLMVPAGNPLLGESIRNISKYVVILVWAGFFKQIQGCLYTYPYLHYMILHGDWTTKTRMSASKFLRREPSGFCLSRPAKFYPFNGSTCASSHLEHLRTMPGSMDWQLIMGVDAQMDLDPAGWIYLYIYIYNLASGMASRKTLEDSATGAAEFGPV